MGVDPGTSDWQPLNLNLFNLKPFHIKMAWHKGTWWPLYVKEWYAPKSSQHMFDPYSFCLLVLGLIFHPLWGTDNIDNWIFGFLLAIVLELIWEVIGNSQFVLKRIRDNSGTSGEYIGDSIQNIFGDIFSCAIGYILGTVFVAVELWWFSLVWVIVSEAVCIWYMRDSLLMTVLTLLVHSDKLKTWQCVRIPKENTQGYFISRLSWFTAKKKAC